MRESVYEGVFDTPKTEAGCRRMPLSAGAVERVGSELALVFDRRESSVPCRIKEKAVTVLFGAAQDVLEVHREEDLTQPRPPPVSRRPGPGTGSRLFRTLFQPDATL